MVKNLPANAGDTGSISGSGRSPGRMHGNPLLDSCLGNPMDRGSWWVQCIKSGTHSVTKQQQILISLCVCSCYVFPDNRFFKDALPM